jgi:hypothetical protein
MHVRCGPPEADVHCDSYYSMFQTEGAMEKPEHTWRPVPALLRSLISAYNLKHSFCMGVHLTLVRLLIFSLELISRATT